MATSTPRGIRCNNPGNIRDSNDKWQGLSKIDNDDQFAVFDDPTWGIRAMATILITYQDRYKLRSVRGVIGRWAPPNENDTSAYVNAVAAACGVSADDIIDVHRYDVLCPLVEAIIRHENGKGPKATLNTWYDRATIDSGLSKAGIVKPHAVVAAVPVTKETVAATGTAGLGVAQIADVAPQIITALDSQQDHLSSGSYVRMFIGVATIAVAVYIAYSQVKKHQTGVVA